MSREKTDFELFDTSDVKYEILPSKKRTEVMVVLKSATGFNVVKTYLALKEIVEAVEAQLNIMEESDGCH